MWTWPKLKGMMKSQEIKGSCKIGASRCRYFSLWLISFKYRISIYVNFFLVLCILVFILYSFWMVDPTVSLSFKFKKSPNLSNLLRNSICWNRNGHCWHDIFKKFNQHILNKINMGIVQKPGGVVAYNSPGRFLLLIGSTILVILRYIIADR